MVRIAVIAAVAWLGCVVACAVAHAPANGTGETSGLDRDASVAPAASVAQVDLGDAADAGEAGDHAPDGIAVASSAPDASVADHDGDASVTIVSGPGAGAGEVAVFLLVNAEAFRANPVGAQLGPVLATIPQLGELARGADLGLAWAIYTGPSLVHTSHGIVELYCTAPDARIDAWIDEQGARYGGPTGGPFDAGPGVHAALGRADNGARVFMRPRPHLLAIVPPVAALQAARALQKANVRAHLDPGEAYRLIIKNPHHSIPDLPATLTEARFWLAFRKDQGADFFLEGVAPDATQAADELRGLLARGQTPIVHVLTHGLLDHPDVTVDHGVARVHVQATERQLEALLQLLQAALHTTP